MSAAEETGGGALRRRGFTLIELLTVIAVIGVLAAILIPTMSKVRQSANNSRTQAQFSQWITAIESFQQEYGYWPDFRAQPSDWQSGETHDDNYVIRINDNADIRRNFIEFLTGRQFDGDSFRDAGFRYQNHPNRRGIEFYSFSETDYELRNPQGGQSPGNLFFVDAFGNTDIVVVIDADRDGRITLRDEATYAVRPGFDDSSTPTATPLDPGQSEQVVRAGVVIYSAGKEGNSPQQVRENIVTSWR